MQIGRIFYVGSTSEVSHHVRPLVQHLPIEAVEPAAVLERIRPGDVAVFFSEHFDRFRSLIVQLRGRNIPTLYAIDGILEWRNAWQNRPDEIACPWTMRPCLSHVVATIGPRQTAVLNAWGNPQCIEVGLPRLDSLASPADSATPPRDSADAFRILVLTAKCPGFTTEQVQTTVRSLQALRVAVAHQGVIGQRRLELCWRLSAGLEQALGVTDNHWNAQVAPEASGLVDLLQSCDAVVTTPSTAMLEAMLLQRPVALLDFHNTPTMADAVWQISGESQIVPVLSQMVRFQHSVAHQHWQQFLLQENLAADGRATERMVKILRVLLAASEAAAKTGQPLAVPLEELRQITRRVPVPSPALFSQLRPPRIHPTASDTGKASARAANQTLDQAPAAPRGQASTHRGLSPQASGSQANPAPRLSPESSESQANPASRLSPQATDWLDSAKVPASEIQKSWGLSPEERRGLSPQASVSQANPAAGLSPQASESQANPTSRLSPQASESQANPAACLSPQASESPAKPALGLSPQASESQADPASHLSPQTAHPVQVPAAPRGPASTDTGLSPDWPNSASLPASELPKGRGLSPQESPQENRGLSPDGTDSISAAASEAQEHLPQAPHLTGTASSDTEPRGQAPGPQPTTADTQMTLVQWQAYTEQLERENQRLSRLVDEAHQVFENMQRHPVLGLVLKSHERWSRWWTGSSGPLAKPDSWSEQ